MHTHTRPSHWRNLCRVFAIVLFTLPLAPRSFSVAQGATPNADCPSHIRIEGPTDGSVGTYYGFSATVSPETSYLSLEIAWYVDGILQGLPDSANPSRQEFSWTTGGTKTVSVTVYATELGGRTCNPISQEHTILISPMPVAEAPLEAYRLAAQLLEEQRAVAPNWADASFYDTVGPDSAGAVTPLYRPGIVGPAYYEFQVYGPTDPNQHRGYIIVSAGEHDHPIPNWSTGCHYQQPGDCAFDYVGWSPTRRMRVESSGTADKFYKLDTLSYVAEDINAVSTGQPVAFVGDVPPRLTLPDGWAENPPPLVTANWVPTITEGIDQSQENSPVTSTLVVTPTVIGEPTLGVWESWSALKTGYTASYQPLLGALEASAAPEWEALRIQSAHGHVLRKGESVAFPLPYPNPSPVPSGPAWDQGLVTVQPETPSGLGPRLVITAVEDVFDQGVPMTVTVTYAGSTVEHLRVIVLNEPEPGIYLPQLLRFGLAGTAAEAPGAMGELLSESAVVSPQAYTPGVVAADGYTYWFVGGTQTEADALQAWYDQYDVPGSCKSGCGPTAWAMLIAYGDRQAHLGTNSAWAGRTGLYRTNGGRGDPAAVAPTGMDDGVKNMVEEIRADVMTFCSAFNSSGATQPFTMHLVGNYLNGRTGASVRTWYLPAGFSVTGADGDAVRSAARNVIQNEGDWRRPTVIGTGFFSHYPLAYGYRQKLKQVCTTSYMLVNGKMTWVTNCYNQLLKGFYVNQGWGDGTGEWVSTDIWFNGRLTPQVTGANDIGFYRSADDRHYFDTDHDLSGQFSFQYPAGTLPYAVRPVVGDFDRDGVLDDLAHVVRSEYWQSSKRYDWYIDEDANGSIERILDKPIGHPPGAWPMVLDHDRDGFVDDIALYSPDTYSYGYMCYEDYCQGYASGGDYWLPVSGDFDRDGDHDDIAFYSMAMHSWAFDMDHDGDWDGGALNWPSPAGDDALPFAGDLDQDGVVDDIGLFDPAYQKWWFDYDHDGNTNDSGTGWGMAGDLPFAGNFWQN